MLAKPGIVNGRKSAWNFDAVDSGGLGGTTKSEATDGFDAAEDGFEGTVTFSFRRLDEDLDFFVGSPEHNNTVREDESTTDFCNVSFYVKTCLALLRSVLCPDSNSARQSTMSKFSRESASST